MRAHAEDRARFFSFLNIPVVDTPPLLDLTTFLLTPTTLLGKDGMALAQDHGVLEEGIPSIWAYDRSTGEATKVRMTGTDVGL